jgi:hypothetical protein
MESRPSSTADARPRGRLYEYFLRHTGKDIHRWHGYFEVYERHLSRFVGAPVAMLEVGIDRAGSLRMWRDFLGPQARLFAIDVNEECRALAPEDVPVFIGDQADREFLRDCLRQMPRLDVVLDDGGHTCRQQITTFEELYPLLADDGLYLVEDTHTNYWKRFIDTDDGSTFVQMAKDLTDRLTEWHFDRGTNKAFRVPPGQRTTHVDVSEFCRTTHSIHFYNSIVAFERRQMEEPFRERR